MRGWAPTRPRRGFSTAGLLRAWIESLETAHGSQSWCPAGAVPRGRQVQPWQPLQQPGRRSVVVAGVGSHGIQRLIWRARHSSVPVAAGGAIRGDGSAGAASAGVPWEFPWKLGLAGAAASLLYHMHHQRAERQRQMLALPEPPPDVSGQTLEFANQLAPPPEFRHPFEDKSLAWRAMYAVRRAAYLVFVFAPFCMASTLLPVLSGHSAFMKWYLSLMVKTLEDAGASFQKLGQWFSMRPDLFDQSVIQALSSLRDDGPRHPFSYTRKLLEDSFECPLEAVFEYLDVEPVASGSVAQVHRGRLSESFVRDCIANGDMDSESQMRDVAVKVIHPGVVESAWIDGNIIFGSVQLLAGITGMGLVMPFDKDGFCRAMARQLNLKWEAYNLKQFSLNFAAESGLEFPRVVAARDSVLIESWFSGKPITDLLTGTFGLAAAPAHGTEVEQAEAGPPQQTASAMLRRHSSRTAAAVDSLVQVSEAKRKALAKAIFDMTIKMYLRDNFIHADLHAGNILYSTDPLDTRVFVLDAGMTTCLEKDWASPFGYMLHALTLGNAKRVAEKLLMFNVNASPVDHDKFTAELQRVMGLYINTSAGRPGPNVQPVNMGVMMGHILMVLQEHKVSLRSDVAMTIVTMSISEGLIRSLDPDFDVVNRAIPYFVRFRSWSSPSLNGAQWDHELVAKDGGLPQGGSRGVAVTAAA